MKDFVRIQSDWFVRTNQFIFDYFKSGGEAFVTDIKYLQVKQEVYMAIVSSFNRIMMLSDGEEGIDTGSNSEFRNIMSDIRLDLREAYDRMNRLNPETNRGFAETMSEVIVKEWHRNLPLPKTHMNKVRARMIEFWNSFFRLPTGSKEETSEEKEIQSDELEVLVNELEADLAVMLRKSE